MKGCGLKYGFLMLLMLFFSSRLMAQRSVVDSLESELSEVLGADRIPLLLQLAEKQRSSQPEIILRYGEEALKLLERFPDPTLEAEVRYQMGWGYIYLREYGLVQPQAAKIDSIGKALNRWDLRAEAYLLKGRTARQLDRYDLGIAILDSALVYETDIKALLRLQLYNELGSIYRRKGANSKALEYHNKALELARGIDDTRSISTTLGYIGIIHDIMGHYDEALKTHQETLKLRQELDDRRGVAAAITNIGILHQKIKNYPEAMDYYRQALEVWEELNREPELAATYNNMGAVEDLLENYESALAYYRQALAIWERLGNTHSSAIALSNIGNIQSALGNYEEALTMIERSYEIRNEVGDLFGSASSLLDMADLYNNLGQTNRALEAAHRGLSLAEETKSWPLIRDAHELLSVFYKNLEQYELSLEHFSEYKAANDSVFNIESQSVIAELQQTYKTQEQQQQIAMLQQREKISRIWLGVLAGGILVIAVFMVLIHSRYRLKKRAHEALEQLHAKEIEQAKLVMEKAEATAKYLQAENERKSQELEAARDMQLSMLPSELPAVPNADIAAMMKTAAEVGGDYYDFNVSEDGTLTMVIGDATGHGVKAGTMVTATKSLFNLLAEDESLTGILAHSSAAIKKLQLPKLYMALALLRLRGRNLQLTGAGMPPALIYRAKTGRVEKIELKGMPLGSAIGFPYEQKSTVLEKDDVLLLCSDGFPELFNSEGEMFGYDAIPKLLAEAGDRSAEEIVEHLKNAGSRWIGEGTHDDDITFVVLKSK